MSGPLTDSKVTDGCLTCPWHGSVFGVAGGAVVRGPADVAQPAFKVRGAGGVIQVRLPVLVNAGPAKAGLAIDG